MDTYIYIYRSIDILQVKNNKKWNTENFCCGCSINKYQTWPDRCNGPLRFWYLEACQSAPLVHTKAYSYTYSTHTHTYTLPNHGIPRNLCKMLVVLFAYKLKCNECRHWKTQVQKTKDKRQNTKPTRTKLKVQRKLLSTETIWQGLIAKVNN